VDGVITIRRRLAPQCPYLVTALAQTLCDTQPQIPATRQQYTFFHDHYLLIRPVSICPMNPSPNLFIIGPTGAGKTSIGRRLAAHYGLPFADLDQEIEQHCGVDVSTVFEIEGETGFRQRESALLDACSQRPGVLLATGAGAVLDPDNRRHLRERGYVIWLQASIEQQLQRLERDHRRPLLAVPDRQQRLQAMAQVREPIYRELADLAVSGGHDSIAAASDHCIALIDHHWQRSPGTSSRQTA